MEAASRSESVSQMNLHLDQLEALSQNCAACQKLNLDHRTHLVHHTRRDPKQSQPQAASTVQDLEPQEGTTVVVAKSPQSAETEEKNDESVVEVVEPLRITRGRLEAAAHGISSVNKGQSSTKAANARVRNPSNSSSASSVAKSKSSQRYVMIRNFKIAKYC